MPSLSLVILALEDVLVPLIQQQLGHTSQHETTFYFRHIPPVELVETIRQQNWNSL